MNILALDGSQKNCQISIIDLKKSLNLKLEHEGSIENLPDFLRESLGKHNVQLNEFSHLGCILGPGNYTGLRASQLIVKSFAAIYSDLKVYAVNRLEALIYALGERSTSVLASQSVRQNEYYAALGYYDGQSVVYEQAPQTYKQEALQDYWESHSFEVTGDWQEAPEHLRRQPRMRPVDALAQWMPSGLQPIPAQEIQPFYIRPATQARPKRSLDAKAK